MIDVMIAHGQEDKIHRGIFGIQTNKSVDAIGGVRLDTGGYDDDIFAIRQGMVAVSLIYCIYFAYHLFILHIICLFCISSD
jgi:hypothetical protein